MEQPPSVAAWLTSLVKASMSSSGHCNASNTELKKRSSLLATPHAMLPLIWLSLPALLCRVPAHFVSKFSVFTFADCDSVSAMAAGQVHLAHLRPLALLMCVQAHHLKRSSGLLQLLPAGSQTRTRTNGKCPKLLLYRTMMGWSTSAGANLSSPDNYFVQVLG